MHTVETFSKLYLINAATGCWVWQGLLDYDGYGHGAAHRISWKLHRGPIPEKMLILHSCDNRACVNPDHLWLGTHLDNMRDMAQKNRRVTRQRVLTKEDVEQIRADYRDWNFTIRGLAANYGISYRHTRRILRGLRWRDDTSIPRKY